MAIFGFLIGFTVGAFITSYLSVKKAETHDFTLVDGKAHWVERPSHLKEPL